MFPRFFSDSNRFYIDLKKIESNHLKLIFKQFYFIFCENSKEKIYLS